jgi:DtxR family transcriptional regulator, manganese transport regulator
MTSSRPHSAPHHRTRKDHSTETAEDYVEAIAEIIDEKQVCRVTDLTDRFGVTHVTVSRIVKRLQQEGWLETRPHYPIDLTPKGRRLAQESKQRHQIVYDFLIAFGLDAQTAAIDSEGIEHHVSKKTLDLMKAFVEKKSG